MRIVSKKRIQFLDQITMSVNRADMTCYRLLSIVPFTGSGFYVQGLWECGISRFSSTKHS